MKILIIPSWYPDNDNSLKGIFFKELAEALAKKGNDVAVLYFDISFRMKRKNIGIKYEIINGVHEFRCNQKNLFPGSVEGAEIQNRFKVGFMCKKIAESFGIPDVIHLESCSMINIALDIKKRFGRPLVYTEHLSNVLKDQPEKFYFRRFKKALSKCDTAIAISEPFKRKMNRFGLEKVTLIPNGIAIENFKNSRHQGVFTIKALGSLREIKGYDVLIKAFAEFAKDKEDTKLIIGGTGNQYDYLLNLRDLLAVENDVVFVGKINREKISDFYSDCSLFVCSSSLETFSIVTAEALCSGVPVVSTRCKGPESMINKDNGLLVDVGNVKQMAEAFQYMYNNLELYDRRQIAEYARVKFGYDSVVSKHIKVYTEVIDGGI